MTVGIHLIWTTYMTWLPGDPRGHWSPLFNFYGHLIERGHKLNLPDPVTLQRATDLAKGSQVVLTEDEQRIVADTIGEMTSYSPRLAGGLLHIHAAAIERTHTHLLLAPVKEDISRVAGRIKGQTSSKILGPPEWRLRDRIWTTGYWKVFVFDETALAAVQDYIEQHNIRRGLPRSPHPWIRRFEHQ